MILQSRATSQRISTTCRLHTLSRLCLAVGISVIALCASAQNPSSTLPAIDPESLPLPDSIPVPQSIGRATDLNDYVVADSVWFSANGILPLTAPDTISVLPTIKPTSKFSDYDIWEEREVAFNPQPNRAVWLSALFPGLGQVYNRRYWKLPIIVGGYLGLGYATSWNNTMLGDYTRAYRDIMDTDPTTNSYMNFFPSTITEEDLDKAWLTKLLKTRKDYFRRNRDLCIISMVGVYLLAMVDAYVDASLSHFDITPDLSIHWSPSIMHDGRNTLPSVGLNWALNF